jgi:putative transposase
MSSARSVGMYAVCTTVPMNAVLKRRAPFQYYGRIKMEVSRQSTGRGKARRAPPSVQRELPFRTWGGRRAGAGRKPKGTRAGVPHLARPDHKARHPVHVTLRAVRRLPSLRRQGIFLELRRAFGCYCAGRFRVVHFSVQTDHVHLLVEAADKDALSRGARGLSIRLARAVNRLLGRSGRLWGDRYHARSLVTPREVRHALVYVLMNWRKHVRGARGLDPCASAFWFDGWQTSVRVRAPPMWNAEDVPPVAPPRTWLGAAGWRRYGLVGVGERPNQEG